MATNTLHIPIDKAGRVVLPKEVRDRMHLHPGTEFEVMEEQDRIVLKPVEKQPRLVRKGGILVFVPEKSTENLDIDIVKLIKKDREARDNKLRGPV